MPPAQPDDQVFRQSGTRGAGFSNQAPRDQADGWDALTGKISDSLSYQWARHTLAVCMIRGVPLPGGFVFVLAPLGGAHCPGGQCQGKPQNI